MIRGFLGLASSIVLSDGIAVSAALDIGLTGAVKSDSSVALLTYHTHAHVQS